MSARCAVHPQVHVIPHVFSQKCRKQLQAWKTLLEEAKNDAPQAENEHYRQLEEQHQEEHEKLQELLHKVAKQNRAISNTQRKIDTIPTRAELVQYERRFVELYDQVRWKFEETKQYYVRYNTLSETINYLKKEMDLLDSIHEKCEQVSSCPLLL